MKTLENYLIVTEVYSAFNCYGETAFVETFTENTVTFNQIKSDKAKYRLLSKGFSPAINLKETRQNTDIGYLYFVEDSELVIHLLANLFDKSLWIRQGINRYQFVK